MKRHKRLDETQKQNVLDYVKDAFENNNIVTNQNLDEFITE